ncbi:PadR family transcriptional regulator [Radiobacillus sp. PE A8.2]|uniref:PadR family transcriptional regulator n=1 Tax=Radiobacillus sp. PE A8.2 TaxID=3380349 RepID=UPI00388FC4D5
MSSRSQLLKGILEGCILAIINSQTTYGYELSLKLQENGLSNVSEGSIYPILLRLQKEQLIIGTMQKSETGPKRKYYTLTPQGKETLRNFEKHWESIKSPVDNILKQGGQ